MARNDTGFGGTNGMTGFSTFFGMPIASREAVITMATASILATLIGFVLLAMLMASSFGRTMIAIRDDEARLRFLGTNTLWPKLTAWCLSAVLAAIAGALYVPQVGIINPTQLSPANSIEIAVWVAVGGRGYLVGALIGATLVNALKFWLTGFAPAAWPFILAGLVLVIAVGLTNGLMDIGEIRQRVRTWFTRAARRRSRISEKRP
jgi:urea transport system permease protein